MSRASAALEALLRIALPPLRLALRERYLVVRRQDPTAAVVAAEELAADRAQRFGTVVVVM